GPFVGSRGVRRRMVFPCADGHVSLLLMGAQGSPSTRALMRWMDEHGMLPTWLREWPWEQWEPGWAMEASPAAQAELVRIEEAVAAFLHTRTKAEVYREGVRRRILVAPVATVADIAADPQLAFREYLRPRDDVVRLGPPWHEGKPGIERSQFYASYNTSKLGIALDLSKPAARDIARRLAAWADVLVESYTPRVMRRFGLAYADLRQLNPRLV